MRHDIAQVGVKLHEEETDGYRRPCLGFSLQCHDAGALQYISDNANLSPMSGQLAPYLWAVTWALLSAS